MNEYQATLKAISEAHHQRWLKIWAGNRQDIDSSQVALNQLLDQHVRTGNTLAEAEHNAGVIRALLGQWEPQITVKMDPDTDRIQYLIEVAGTHAESFRLLFEAVDEIGQRQPEATAVLLREGQITEWCWDPEADWHERNARRNALANGPMDRYSMARMMHILMRPGR